MSAEKKVQDALRLLKEAGCLDMVPEDALVPRGRPGERRVGWRHLFWHVHPLRCVSQKKSAVSMRLRGGPGGNVGQDKGKVWRGVIPTRPSRMSEEMRQRAVLRANGNGSGHQLIIRAGRQNGAGLAGLAELSRRVEWRQREGGGLGWYAGH
ncbi:hypothetical protein NDU88_006078 [Pleurodeles waltl]|uniref:Uncharacterized protein n=1 Tax=Pleurodeles waltl TaxID=8319 RepID=A0AAV7QGX7_PLEWA|nr:hypothetical protein NDU88_006078 [Pleurodeles waltl]